MLSAAAVFTVALALLGSGYGDSWRRSVRIQQQYVHGADSSDFRIRCAEYMDGVTLTTAGRDSTLEGRVLGYGPKRVAPVRWLEVSEAERHGKRDSTEVVDRTLALVSQQRPFRVSLTYRSDRDFVLRTAHGTGQRSSLSADGPRRRTLEWYSYPPASLPVRVTLELAPGQQVSEFLEVVYDDTPMKAAVRGPWLNVTRRTTVTRADTIRAS
jgi:hypothetical protein